MKKVNCYSFCFSSFFLWSRFIFIDLYILHLGKNIIIRTVCLFVFKCSFNWIRCSIILLFLLAWKRILSHLHTTQKMCTFTFENIQVFILYHRNLHFIISWKGSAYHNISDLHGLLCMERKFISFDYHYTGSFYDAPLTCLCVCK